MSIDSNDHLDLIAQKLRPIPLPPLPENPLVSVLTANYNYARFIGEAIESVQKQTYTNWEMIVCDDGSTDNSCEIVEGHARLDPRIKLIRKENGGVASALNAAYTASKGQVISFLDADDAWLPGKLSAVVDAFVRNPMAGFVGHRLRRVDEGGRPQGTLPLLRRPPSGWLAETAMCNGGILGGLPPCSGMSLRRDVAERIFPLPEAFRSCADAVVMRLCPLMTHLAGLSDVHGTYRLHRANITNAAKVTPDRLALNMQVCQVLWDVQYEYLRTNHPELAPRFAPLSVNVSFLLESYMRLKLSGEKRPERYLERAIESPEFRSLPGPWRCFLRVSRFLPRRLFRRSLNLVLGQGAAKRWVSVLVGSQR
jgi:glycosyltransferase involved in cell wall biosynthesis